MSCDGGHLGFPIGIKNSNLVKDIPMIIPVQFGFSQFISFREENLWNFGQSEHIIGLGSHIEYPTETKNSNFVEDHPRNIPAKFGEEAWNVKSLQTTDDRRQVMAIVHMDLWSRWTKNRAQALVARTYHHPFFSNFLFTNLFSIKFLYFFIISSLFPYFNLFVSIFIQSYHFQVMLT